jgi:cytochrome c-type biogenesis protein CcsB
MSVWIRRLGSLKLAVGLLAAILVALAVGTVIESMNGTEAARGAVYAALWFRALLGLLCVNVAASILERWPWGRWRVGFLLTHGSLLVILAGGLVTELAGLDGHLAIWEGESGSTIALPGGESSGLPFSIRLESFEIDTYPGTQRPAMFRSRVVVQDPARGATRPAVIQMNQELSYGGYRFFQSSYQRTPERDMTVLSVAKDPGQPIVFFGYFMLLAGMITVLVTRIVQRRAETAGSAGPSGLRTLGKGAAAGLGILLAAPVLAGPIPDRATVDALRGLPVQHDGRTMPLDTLAREAVWNVTGRSAWGGADPVATVLGWTFHGDVWAAERVVRVGSSELVAQCAVGADGGRSSFLELVQNRCVLDLIRQAGEAERADRPVAGVVSKAQDLEQRLLWMQGLLQGTSYRVVPPPGDPSAEWGTLPGMRSHDELKGLLAGARPAAWPARSEIDREIRYNRIRPSRLSWWILAAAAIVSVVAWNRERRWLDAASLAGLAAGFAVMTWGIATRWQIAGRIPAANMYESLLFLGWGVALFALVAFLVLRNRLVVLNATLMSALTMALTDLLPIDGFIHPVPPVLAGTAWLAIHVPIIMLSYSVLALGVVVAHMQIGFEVFAPSRRDLSARMSDLLYWYIQVGSILLVAGILTGSMWAASSWGRYWGWDPKEVWSLVAFLAYIAILHGRFDRWLGPFGVAVTSIVGFWTILMTYVGVNFILAAGLHSYGFGSSAVAKWLVGVALVEALFLIVGAMAHAGIRRREALAPTA